jgi:sarcosine oxidase
MSNPYDVIVVGLGAMGSAAAYHLALRGQRVLGIEMFQPGHDQGSSHGYHRMIRHSSFKDDGYVPLAARAFELWHDLEEASGKTLLTMTGEVRLLDEMRFPHELAAVKIMAARGFLEQLSEADLRERFPGFRLHEGMSATYEANAGYLRSEEGIITHCELAMRHGAEIRTGEEVTGIAPDGNGVRITTTHGSYAAQRAVLTPGCWAPELLAILGIDLPMQVERRVNGYFQPERPDLWSLEQGAPDFLLTVEEGSFYGMPAVGDVGLKIGLSAGPPTTAHTIRRTVDPEEIALLRDVLDRYMPGASGEEVRHITCMCTYTRDMDFVIDHHPEHGQIVIACGMSGRGYKFAPVVGEVLADLAVNGVTRHDIAFLAADRFAGIAEQAAVG